MGTMIVILNCLVCWRLPIIQHIEIIPGEWFVKCRGQVFREDLSDSFFVGPMLISQAWRGGCIRVWLRGAGFRLGQVRRLTYTDGGMD